MQGQDRLTNCDRWFLIQLYRWFPSILNVLTIVRPETLVRWHRLIGSIRWECLDHIVVTGEQHPCHILKCYMEYYNAVRTHLSLGKDAPFGGTSSAPGASKCGPSLVGRIINTCGFNLR
jgi:hypothetical protein